MSSSPTLDHPPESIWLWPPRADASSLPALLWTDHMGEVVQAHETPMGACLLSPQSPSGWNLRPSPSPTPPVIAPSAEPEIETKPPSPDKKRQKKRDTRVDRWSEERYRTAEIKLVEIMRRIGADLGKPIPRQELRDEVRKHIGDTGLLDHLLKHMVGKVVADGAERLRRRHNLDGTMEYWLESVDLADIRWKAGVTDPFWVPPPGWKLGDATSLCPFGRIECMKEASLLREEVAALKRDYQSLLQWKGKLEEETEEEEVVQWHEILPDDCHLSPLSAGLTGWGVRRKVVRYTRRHREMPSLFSVEPETSCEQWVRKKRSPRMRKMNYHERDPKKAKYDKEEKRGREISDQTSDFKVERWSSARYKAAERKLVDIMHKMKAGLWSPVIRQALREETRKHIGDTGLLDHLLKHLVGKIVANSSERLQRRYNTEGAMEYWLEPADLAEIRRKAGVLDPSWVPPPGWKLGDAVFPCQCGAKCEKETSLLREEVAKLKREVERLNLVVQLEKQATKAIFEAGGIADLAEMDEQGGKSYGWYVRLLAGTGEYLEHQGGLTELLSVAAEIRGPRDAASYKLRAKLNALKKIAYKR